MQPPWQQGPGPGYWQQSQQSQGYSQQGCWQAADQQGHPYGQGWPAPGQQGYAAPAWQPQYAPTPYAWSPYTTAGHQQPLTQQQPYWTQPQHGYLPAPQQHEPWRQPLQQPQQAPEQQQQQQQHRPPDDGDAYVPWEHANEEGPVHAPGPPPPTPPWQPPQVPAAPAPDGTHAQQEQASSGNNSRPLHSHWHAAPVAVTAGPLVTSSTFTQTAAERNLGSDESTSAAAQTRQEARPAHVVFVWDLDETLILFNSLLNGQYTPQGAGDSGVAKERARRAAEAWADVTFDVLDHVFDFPAVEHTDPGHLDDALPSQPQPPQQRQQQDQHPSDAVAAAGGSITAAQRAVFARARDMFCAGLPALPLPPELRGRMDAAWAALEAATGGWASAAAGLLAALLAAGGTGGGPASVTHCLVTRGQLLASLVKVLLFRFDASVHCHNVFSASKESKLALFQRIADRFGPDCRYVAVGDGPEEQAAAARIGWPFVKIVVQPGTGRGGGSTADGGANEAAVAVGKGAGTQLASAAGCTIHELTVAKLLAIAGR